jgi:RNA recognition motif-containing protein
MQKGSQNVVYFYGLPANNVTSNQLRQKISEMAGIDLKQSNQPQIRRDLNKPEWSALVKLDSEDDAKKVHETMRFFNWFETAGQPVSEIRTLLYDPEIRNREDPEVMAKNVFVRQLQSDVMHSNLFTSLTRALSQEGMSKEQINDEIKSVKVCIDADTRKSKKFGFASFKSKEAAEKITKLGQTAEGASFHVYQPKPRSEMRKIFNNIVVKNFMQDDNRINEPAYIEDRKEYVKKIFAGHGEITSIHVTQINSKKAEAPKRLMAFVCFKDPETAMKVVEDFKEKEVDGHELYVAEALKKSQLAKEIYKFKNSKKRCNLFVKGFPEDITEEKLREFFNGVTGQPDAIESLKLEKDKNNPAIAKFAFVCFKSPDIAITVKNKLNQDPNQNLAGKRLTVNNYELKEVRQVMQMEARDKADFQNATRDNSFQNGQIDHFFQKPELINTLMFFMQQLQHGKMGRGNMNMANRSQGRPNNMMGRPGPQQRPPMPQHQMAPKPAPQMPQPAMGMQQPGMMPGMPPAAMMGGMPPMQQNPLAMRFAQTCSPIIPGINESNPAARDLVGEKVYEFVIQIAGEDLAPKITGMLIDLPSEEIREFLADFGKFQNKVMQAKQLLNGGTA